MNNIIYHYCNIDSFKAIIQNRTLWLSSIYNLNDYKEIHWIKDKVSRKIKELTTKDNFSKYKIFEELYLKQHPLLYIASFSQGKDLLSQWRAYANDGKGVAIGFNANYFNQIKYIKNTEVLYSEEEQDHQISQIIQAIDEFDKIKMKNDLKSFIVLCEEVISQINNLAAKSKNELFKEEQEVRLIHNPKIISDEKNSCYKIEESISTMKFRSCHDSLIPYFELKFDKEIENIIPIIEIIKGPKNRAIDEEIKMFMALHGFCGVNVKKSNASYR